MEGSQALPNYYYHTTPQQHALSPPSLTATVFSLSLSAYSTSLICLCGAQGAEIMTITGTNFRDCHPSLKSLSLSLKVHHFQVKFLKLMPFPFTKVTQSPSPHPHSFFFF